MFSLYKPLQRLIIRYHCSMINCSINIPNEIKIPKKIYRDKLSVLKALSTCVQNEKGCPEYGIIDQPFTNPADYLARKRFVWSKISGKISARIAFKENKNEFLNVALDEPRVKSLMPLMSAEDVEREVREKRLSFEKGLGKLVRLLLPQEAWSFYEANKATKFSSEVLQSLLELLCATAGVSSNEDYDPEDQFKEKEDVEWRIDNTAELLFADMEEKSLASYYAMIRGASKFNNPSRALDFYRIMQTNFQGSFLDLATVNSLLRSLKHSTLSDLEIKDLIIELLEGMAHHKVTPTTHTFNNAIVACSQRYPVQFVQSLYAEMLKCDLEPTLGTYSILLKSKFTRTMQNSLAFDILKILEARQVDYEETTSIDDRTLFSTMMPLFRRMWRVDLALRLNDVVDRGGRFHMFIDDLDRGRYLDTFVRLLIEDSDNLGPMLDVVSRYVPKYYMMRAQMAGDVIDQIRRSGQIHLIPKVVHLINWNAVTNVNCDVFPRILSLCAELDYTVAGIPEMIGECLARVLQDCRRRITSVFTVPSNTYACLSIAATIGDQTLFWDLMAFADSHRFVRASIVTDPMVHCFNSKNFDRIAYLWQCLKNGVHCRAMTADVERESLRSLIALVEAEMLPTLLEFNIAVRETRANIDHCKAWLEKNYTEADFDEEEAAELQLEKDGAADLDQ